MLKKLMETMGKELKETMKAMTHQIENSNKKIDIIKNNWIEIVELKNTLKYTENFIRGD